MKNIITQNISVDFIKNASKSALISVSCIIMATGCSSSNMSSFSGVEPQNRNQVEMVRIPYMINFVTDADNIDDREIARLNQFLNESDVSYGDEFSMDFPLERNGDLSELNQKRLRYLSALLKEHGLYMAASVTPYGMEPNANTGRLLISKYVVTPPVCGDWRQPSYPNYNNAPMSNLGCASQANLGLMVANPRDLITGQQGGAPNAERAASAIEHYQNTNVTVAPVSTTESSGN